MHCIHYGKAILLGVMGIFMALTGQAQKKPNIILIMADDLGYETLGCNGNDDQLTPQLDLLAKTGMRFDNCYANPLCTPSRVQLMTGKYNHKNYIGFGLLDPNETSFGTLMQQQGYKTCIAGKWQLWGNQKQWDLANGKKGTLPQNAGYDAYCLWQVDSLGSRYANPTIYMPPGVSGFWKDHYGPDIYNNYIEEFMEAQKGDPFFVYYPLTLTHDPFTPTPFSAQEAPAKDKQNEYFKDMVRYMDYLVGRLVAKTEALGIRENTLIVFIGDNGTSKKITSHFKGKKVVGNKGGTNKLGTHVPMIVNGKGLLKPGTVNKSLIDFTDFVPTLLDIAEAKTPRPIGLDGLSFYPQLKGQYHSKREWVFCHYDPRWGNYPVRTFVHDGVWKVYATGEMYDLIKDPEELAPIKPNDLTSSQKAKTIAFQQIIKDKLSFKN